MIKVLIVEDHESMCDALKKTFNDTNEFTVVGEVPNANLALLYCQKLNPDLVLVDVCTEGNASGIEATKDIKKSCPDIKVIIMTAFDEISYLPRAKSAGADGFIYKSKSLNYFLETSKDVISGKTVFPEEKKVPVSMVKFLSRTEKWKSYVLFANICLIKKLLMNFLYLKVPSSIIKLICLQKQVFLNLSILHFI